MINGVDTDVEQLAVNRHIVERVGLSNVGFPYMDVSFLKYNQEVDLVLCVDNLEYVEDNDKVCSLLTGAIKKVGRLLL